MMKCDIALSSLTNLRRHAIVLNNIGVSLLEKHCYDQAVATLKDSLSIVRSITHGIGLGENNDNIYIDQHLLDTAISMHEFAIKRISNPTPSKQQVVKFEAVYLLDSSPTVDSSSIAAITTKVSNYLVPSFRLIRLDSLVDGTMYDNKRWNKVDGINHDAADTHDVACISNIIDLESAVVLHNIGLAAYCIFRVCPLKNPSYQTFASKAIHSSHTMYTKALNAIANINITGRHHNRTDAMPVMLPAACRLELLGGMIIVLKSMLVFLEHLPISSSASSISENAAFYRTVLHATQRRVMISMEAKNRLGLCAHNAMVA
jgi:hypothetical protein